MNLTTLLIFLAIGTVAGWLAGQLLKGGGYGLLGNMVIGIVRLRGRRLRVRSVRHRRRQADRLDRYRDRRRHRAAMLCVIGLNKRA